MIAALFAAAAVAAAPAPAQPKNPPKEPTPAELKAENEQLKGQVTYLSGFIKALRAQRDQNAEQSADLAARLQTGR